MSSSGRECAETGVSGAAGPAGHGWPPRARSQRSVARVDIARRCEPGESTGDAKIRFLLVRLHRELLRDKQIRPMSDWGPSGRRFKSCQPDAGQSVIAGLQKPQIRYPPGVWIATGIATQFTDRVSRRGRRLRLATLETDTKFWDAPGRAVARPAVDRPEVVESRLGQSQLILKPGCVAPVRGILSGLGLAPYLAERRCRRPICAGSARDITTRRDTARLVRPARYVLS